MSVEPAKDSRLTRCDLEGTSLANPLQTSEIQSTSVRFEDLGFRRQRRYAPAEGVDSSKELPNGERFGQVVIGTRFEPGHFVVLGSTSGQHQDVQRWPCPAETATDLDPVEIRQHEIEEDEIENPLSAENNGFFAKLAGDNFMPRGRKEVGEAFAKRLFILDDENPHASG